MRNGCKCGVENCIMCHPEALSDQEIAGIMAEIGAQLEDESEAIAINLKPRLYRENAELKKKSVKARRKKPKRIKKRGH